MMLVVLNRIILMPFGKTVYHFDNNMNEWSHFDAGKVKTPKYTLGNERT